MEIPFLPCPSVDSVDSVAKKIFNQYQPNSHHPTPNAQPTPPNQGSCTARNHPPTAADVGMHTGKPHLLQINPRLGAPQGRLEILAHLVYRHRMAGVVDDAAGLGVVEQVRSEERR